jgi:putative endonuclease
LTRADDRQGLGRYAEERAAQHLTRKGYEILDRNWRCEVGELDLIAKDGTCLVCVEVRARRGRMLGTPEESITAVKQARLVELAQAYTLAHDWRGDYRIDIVAIEMDRRGHFLRLDHYENAVTG